MAGNEGIVVEEIDIAMLSRGLAKLAIDVLNHLGLADFRLRVENSARGAQRLFQRVDDERGLTMPTERRDELLKHFGDTVGCSMDRGGVESGIILREVGGDVSS